MLYRLEVIDREIWKMCLNQNGSSGLGWEFYLWTVSDWAASYEGQYICPDLWAGFTVENVILKLCPWLYHREELCGIHQGNVYVWCI